MENPVDSLQVKFRPDIIYYHALRGSVIMSCVQLSSKLWLFSFFSV